MSKVIAPHLLPPRERNSDHIILRNDNMRKKRNVAGTLIALKIHEKNFEQELNSWCQSIVSDIVTSICNLFPGYVCSVSNTVLSFCGVLLLRISTFGVVRYCNK